MSRSHRLSTQIVRPNKKLGSLAEAGQFDTAEIPITDFSYLSRRLPLTDAELENEFDLVIDPLQVEPNNANSSGRVTSLVRGQTVEEFVYATHVGVVVVPEPKVFALNGVDLQAPAAGAAVASPAFTGLVPFAGVPVAGGTDATARPAQFQWGHDTWQAAWALLNAYNLRMSIGSRFQVFNELAANVGACVSGGFRGLGQMLMSPIEYIQEQNALNLTRGGTRLFCPQTTTAGTPNTPAAPPLVQVGYGGTQLQGAFGGWYPLKGLLLAPGMPINILLERTVGDEQYFARMQRSLSGDSQASLQTYSDRWTGSVVGDIGYAGARIWKGGNFRVGILIRGFSLAPMACYQGYQDMSRHFDPVLKASLYRDSGSMLVEMLKDVIDRAGGARMLSKEQGKGHKLLREVGRLSGFEEIDQIDFGSLAVPAP